MAHRNRWFTWFTVLKNGGSFHGELLVTTRWPDASDLLGKPHQLGFGVPQVFQILNAVPTGLQIQDTLW